MKRLYIMDSTTITLFKDILKGVGRNPDNGRKKGGIKAHTIIRSQDNQPCFIRYTESAKHDPPYSHGDVVPVANRDVVYIVAPDRYMTAINLKDGKTLWRSNDFKVRESIGISQDGKTIYAKTMNDSIIAVHASQDKMEA